MPPPSRLHKFFRQLDVAIDGLLNIIYLIALLSGSDVAPPDLDRYSRCDCDCNDDELGPEAVAFLLFVLVPIVSWFQHGWYPVICYYGVLVAIALVIGAVCEGVKAAYTYISTKMAENFGDESGNVAVTFLLLVVVPILLAVKWGWYCVACYYGAWIALALVGTGTRAAYTWIETKLAEKKEEESGRQNQRNRIGQNA